MQAVGGNTALALLLTIGSNIVGIFSMPFMLSALLGAGAGAVHIAPKPLLQALLKTILAPLMLGALARAMIRGICIAHTSEASNVLAKECSSLCTIPTLLQQIGNSVVETNTCNCQLLAELSAGLAPVVDGRKKLLSLISATLLALVPWMQISKAAADGVALHPTALIMAIAAGVGIHTAFLLFNFTAVHLLSLGGTREPVGDASPPLGPATCSAL